MRMSGDCEDYAIAKFFALRQLGFGAEQMRIVILWDEIRGIGHAVLAVYQKVRDAVGAHYPVLIKLSVDEGLEHGITLDEAGEAGTVARVTKDELVVGTGKGSISVLELQPPGKKAMTVRAFLQGKKLEKGMKFTSQQ